MIGRETVRKVSLGIGLATGVLLLVLALRIVDPSPVVAALAKTDPYLVALGLLTVAATTGAKARRWALLFYPSQRSPSFRGLLSALVIGQMINGLLPARLGELARAYLIGETDGQDKLFALGTIVVEKLLDGLMLLVVLASLFVVMPLPDWLRISGSVSAFLLAGLLVAILFVTRQRQRILRVADSLSELLPVLDRFHPRQRLGVLVDGLDSLRSGGASARLLAWSVAIWFLAALTNCTALLALGIDAPLVVSSLLVLVVLHLGLAVPTSPARIGVFHYLCILSLSLVGVEGSLALAYGFVLHSIVVLPIIFAGLLCLWKENVDLYQLAREVDDG